MNPRFALVAGETSGDLLAAMLLEGMRARWPQLEAGGIGGERMANQRFNIWWPSEKLAVRGYVEVLRHYAEITSIRRRLKARLLAAPPDLFIGVDAPDFNLALETDLRLRGVRTMHFICPSIWAWRPGRIDAIRRACDHVLCLFPFEPALLATAGVPATYVGHPLARSIPEQPDRRAARQALGLAQDKPVLAVLPGSRASEVAYLAEPFVAAAAQVCAARPAVQVVIPAVPSLRAQIERVLRTGRFAQAPLVVQGRSHEVLAACDLALLASGTATLEAALFKRPMVIGYRMNPLSWLITQRQRLQPWVGLPNILAGRFLVPELLQEQARPDRLAQALLDWLDAPDRMRAVERSFTELHRELRRDTPALSVHAIESLLQS